MFNDCHNLSVCDFILPNLNTGSMANIFNNCSSLIVDINSLIPKQGFLHKEINVEKLFNSTAISGTVPANLLWNDSNITWKNTSNTFSNCSDEIRAQVPISWGGTAPDDIIIETDSIYDDTEIRNLLQKKADLVSGKVPESQLPELLKLGETATTAYSGLAGTQLAEYVMNNLEVRIDDINDDLSNTPQLVSRINSRKIYTKQIYY